MSEWIQWEIINIIEKLKRNSIPFKRKEKIIEVIQEEFYKTEL